MVVGGWPCQDISLAGSLGGIQGDHSGLFFDMLKRQLLLARIRWLVRTFRICWQLTVGMIFKLFSKRCQWPGTHTSAGEF